jgi:predicted TIM-barrel fold metal-dependent hydrolase
MPALFEVTDLDRRIYEDELRAFLPDSIVDIHTHVWRDADKSHSKDEFERVVSWPARVAKDCTVEDLVESYRLMFPGKKVTPLMFSSVSAHDDADRLNDYVRDSARAFGFPALLFARPEWSGEEMEAKIAAGGFLGVKVYLSLSPSYLPGREIRIFDFLPPHQLQELDRRAQVAMLHIPRDGRLRDPVNLEQMLEIERSFPRVKLIIAHVGRAYCDEDVGDAFERLGKTRHMVFDFAANTNAHVFEQAIRAFGPERCLFGSDLPITWMRMRRICEGGRYVNLVPRGKYGDVSGDKNMREVDGAEAARLTTFMYEELAAIKRACTRAGVDRRGVEAIFRTNAERVLGWRMP